MATPAMIVIDGAPTLPKGEVILGLSSSPSSRSLSFADLVTEWSTVQTSLLEPPINLLDKLMNCPPANMMEKSTTLLKLQVLSSTYYWDRLNIGQRMGTEQGCDFVFFENGIVSVKMMQKVQAKTMTEEDYYVAERLLKTLCHQEEELFRVILVADDHHMKDSLSKLELSPEEFNFALKMNALYKEEAGRHLNWAVVETSNKSVSQLVLEVANKILTFRKEEMELDAYMGQPQTPLADSQSLQGTQDPVGTRKEPSKSPSEDIDMESLSEEVSKMKICDEDGCV
jgi:hypothetical protein